MKCEIITVRNFYFIHCFCFAAKKKDTGLTRFSLSNTFFMIAYKFFFVIVIVDCCFNSFSTNKNHLALFFPFAFFFVVARDWQCDCQLSHIELNQITLLPQRRIRIRMKEMQYISFNNAYEIFWFCAENWNRFTRQIDNQQTIKGQKVLIK